MPDAVTGVMRSIVNPPGARSRWRSRLGMFRLESAAAFPVESYIEALKEQNVLVAV